jgi:hypothetical protein
VAKRRGNGIALPSGVQMVRARGRAYYYFVPNRNTAYQGKRVALGRDPTDPEFWARLRAARGDDEDAVKPGTFNALLQAYKNSEEWRRLRPRTRVIYEIYLGRIETAWGKLPVVGLTAIGIIRLRDQYEATPVAANHLVSVLRTVLAWGLGRGYGERNPANDVASINILDEQNAKPWPERVYRLVIDGAPEHLRRAAFLGRVTGQRRSDLVKLGKKNRRDDGLQFKIGKRRDLEHFLPLNAAELAEIDSWSCSDTGPWVVSPRGKPMSGDHLAASLRRFIEKTPELSAIEPVALHGLRAMAVCDRRLDGLEHQEISAQLCMSAEMVYRYSRHIDQESLARRANEKRERAANRLKNMGDLN